MITLLFALLSVPAAAAAASAPASLPIIASSTTSAAAQQQAALALGVSTYTVSTLYTGDKTRDPFMPPSMGGGSKHIAGTPIDIHSLKLVGIMKDPVADYAIFNTDFGTTLILRGGKLYDDRSRVIPGITGRIKPKQKWVELVTFDKDVQPFRLGELSATDDKNP
jgi:hypothetical protein